MVVVCNERVWSEGGGTPLQVGLLQPDNLSPQEAVHSYHYPNR